MAAVELVLVLAISLILLGKPLLHRAQAAAQTAPAPHTKHVEKAKPVRVPQRKPLAPPKLPRHETSVLVLNGNGRTGAAAAEAQVVRSKGYLIASVGNAPRANYPRDVVIYRPGFHPEAVRLARDLRIRIVTPLDGLTKRQLRGAQVAVVLGA